MCISVLVCSSALVELSGADTIMAQSFAYCSLCICCFLLPSGRPWILTVVRDIYSMKYIFGASVHLFLTVSSGSSHLFMSLPKQHNDRYLHRSSGGCSGYRMGKLKIGVLILWIPDDMVEPYICHRGQKFTSSHHGKKNVTATLGKNVLLLG